MKYLILACLILTACAKDETTNSKDLFSLWKSDSSQLDLRDGEYGVHYPFSYEVATGTGCNCQAWVEGSNSRGKFYLGSCSYFGVTNYCPSGNVSYTYVNLNATLKVCPDAGGTCEVFK